MEVQDSGEKKFLYGMIVSMLCWGISWPVGKILAAYSIAPNIALIRFALTFVSLFIILIIIRENLKIDKKGIPVLLAAGLCMTAYSYFFLEGLNHGKAGAGGVLTTTLNPILTYVLTMLISLRPPSRKDGIGLLVGLLAGAVLLKIWANAGSIFDPGNLYFVLATITWAVLSKFTSMSSKYGSPLSFSLWMYGICSIMMFVFADKNTLGALLINADSKFWLNMFFSSTITTSMATTYYFYATTKVGADKASGYIFMVPLSAAIGSWIILGEIPLWNTLLGGAIGIAAVYILNYKTAEKK